MQGLGKNADGSARSMAVGVACNAAVAANHANVWVGANPAPGVSAGGWFAPRAEYVGTTPAVGVNVFSWMTWADNTGGSITWYGDNGSSWAQTGMVGEVFG